MRILLAAVNAKFSHTSLAARTLVRAMRDAGLDADFAEYTVNQPEREILADILQRKPDRLLLSCYIWNITLIRQLGGDFNQLCPDVPVILGGPEVSFESEELLTGMPWADAVISGEGEGIVAQVVAQEHPCGVYRAEQFCNLDSLPFAYDDLGQLPNRVLYYESTRGCPFGCAYCLSSADRTVRKRSLPLVFADLQRFLDARVMQVKFVDRTFNLDGERAQAIWRYLHEHDNGVTSFQMELGGDLLTDAQTAWLGTVRAGLFQFEIGVQSTHAPTLEKICRATDLVRLGRNVSAIRAGGRIHQHLDLIAGLPLETFERFGQSYDEVLALRPEQLQLGFLKLLRGSTLYKRREEYGLRFSSDAPYEVLSTPELSFVELSRLERVEALTETYYNSGRFKAELEYLWEFCCSPFWAFLELAERMPARNVGKYEYYDLLYAYGVAKGCDPAVFGWLMRYDLIRHERPRRLPEHCPEGEGLRPRMYGLPKDWQVEVFPFDPRDGKRGGGRTVLAMDYSTGALTLVE